MSKSVEELFRDAPPDATHYAGYCHYKKVNDVWMVHMDGDEWDKSSSMYNGDIKPADIVERPQPKPWSGPEDGLPPVNMVVEVFECTHDYTKRFNGQKVRILCHDNDTAVFAANNFEYHALIKDKFRAIRTPEQLAAEERERAVASMKGVFDSVSDDLMPTSNKYLETLFGALYDAGFKQEVK